MLYQQSMKYLRIFYTYIIKSADNIPFQGEETVEIPLNQLCLHFM